MDAKSKLIFEKMSPYSADALDPFVLQQKLTTMDILKSVVLSVTLLPIRLLLMFTTLIIAWLVGVVTLAGAPREQIDGREPLSGWRRNWVKPFEAKLARLLFFFGGWYWIPQVGRTRAEPGEAPILLVAPHSSFFDTVVVIALGCPGMVAKDSTGTMPFFGSLVRFMQPLYVKSEDPDSRHRIAEEIRDRATSGKNWEQILIFPEGGCGNRRALLQFKMGAFSPGVPVQPVFIRYKNKLDSITWTWDGPGAWKQLWLTLTQFCIKCELEFLPVYKPSKLEKENPRLFADNVQDFISSWTSTPVTRLSLEDARFVRVARQRDLPATASLAKQLRLRKTIGRHSMDPVTELHLLRELNNSSDPKRGDAAAMAKYLGLERCPEALKDFFRVLDQRGSGNLDLRVYDAGLHLMRTDLKPREKLKLAFQALGPKSEAEHLEAILLLWKGVPSSLSNIRAIENIDQIETEDGIGI
ncbi:hypothetical protein JTE90_025173 [Oedothorax gibbosus]|uniref:Phospholipid/glycerol acyltransferase domain-containing protein n=1 Tax=Oedothorax gibbosus TaxID=931172 RepID=A0AAV6UII9_9ARAC|nr:hypothetical protein JTE90_025173 [Oedothorax gibbosus]